LKVAHIQITDHLALGVLKHRIDTEELKPHSFSLQTQCMMSWNLVQDALEKGQVDAAFILAPIAMDLFNIPKNDMYVIYGITDLPNPQLDRNLSSFLYERDGSLRILVMSGSANANPWKIAQQQLHLRLDALLVLNDEDAKNNGSVEKVG